MEVLSAGAVRAIWRSEDPGVDKIRQLTQARHDARRLYRYESKRPELYHRVSIFIDGLETYCEIALGLSRSEQAIFTTNLADHRQIISLTTTNIFRMEEVYPGAKTQSLRGRVDDLQELFEYKKFARDVYAAQAYVPGTLDKLQIHNQLLVSTGITSSILRLTLTTNMSTREQLRQTIEQNMRDFVEAQCLIMDEQSSDSDVQDARQELDCAVNYFEMNGSREGYLLRQVLFEYGVRTAYFPDIGWQTLLFDPVDPLIAAFEDILQENSEATAVIGAEIDPFTMDSDDEVALLPAPNVQGSAMGGSHIDSTNMVMNDE